MTSAIA
jgi:hypothetical protein